MPSAPVLVISGTNRPGSNTLKVAQSVMNLYHAAHLEADLYNLSDLPPEVFQPTSYASKPPAFAPVQQRVIAARGLHLVVPEYNGSFPGVLKYFIDMLKFPESFDRKPVAMVGLSAGMWGAIRPVEHLQGVFGYRNSHIYPDRVFIPGVTSKLDSAGNIIDPSIVERLTKQVTGFARFASQLTRE